MDTKPVERLLRSCTGIHAAPATSTHTGLIYAGLIKENSERFVGVATLLDNGQGSRQAFLAPWLGHVTCSLKDE